MEPADSESTVLVVDDEKSLADLYAEWLASEYTVRTAYDGKEALDVIDDDVDVILLDRRMPDLSGDEVLTEIRNQGFECRVAMVTAVEPDFDVLEMEFDAYLTKPVSRDELFEIVDRLLAQATYEQDIQRYFALLSKRTALENEKPPEELEYSEEYAELLDELSRTEAELDTTLDEFNEGDFKSLFDTLDLDDEQIASDRSPNQE
ncbi:MAG: response regulator [Halobacteriaceae archaeon]